jgi:hypothetical protein
MVIQVSVDVMRDGLGVRVEASNIVRPLTKAASPQPLDAPGRPALDDYPPRGKYIFFRSGADEGERRGPSANWNSRRPSGET